MSPCRPPSAAWPTLLVDPSKPAPLRLGAAAQLARSVQRFGPLVAADQEPKLVAAFDHETDPALRTALGAVIGNLRPRAAPTGVRLRQIAPLPPAGATATDPGLALSRGLATPSETPNPNPSPPAPRQAGGGGDAM